MTDTMMRPATSPWMAKGVMTAQGMAAVHPRPLEEASSTAEKVRPLVRPTPDPDAEIAEIIWRAVRDNTGVHPLTRPFREPQPAHRHEARCVVL
jgi:hypothetical protein